VAKTSPPPIIQTSFLSQFGDWFLEKKKEKKGNLGKNIPFSEKGNMSPVKIKISE
jgi:hypothetical protein